MSIESLLELAKELEKEGRLHDAAHEYLYLAAKLSHQNLEECLKYLKKSEELFEKIGDYSHIEVIKKYRDKVIKR